MTLHFIPVYVGNHCDISHNLIVTLVTLWIPLFLDLYGVGRRVKKQANNNKLRKRKGKKKQERKEKANQ